MSATENMPFSMEQAIAQLMTFVALVVAGGGLWVAARQLRANNRQAAAAQAATNLEELKATYSARLSTLTATIDDLQQQTSILEVQCRLNQQHAERCEAEMARMNSEIRQRKGQS